MMMSLSIQLRTFIIADICNNFLLHGRNITIHVSTSYGFGNPNNLYDPDQALLYSVEKMDSGGRVKIGAWSAGINNKEQYWQVGIIISRKTKHIVNFITPHHYVHTTYINHVLITIQDVSIKGS